MLYSDQFKNFEDFNKRFGFKRNADNTEYLINKNGVRQRNNNIVYQLYKESFKYYKYIKKLSLSRSFSSAIKQPDYKQVFVFLLDLVFSRSTSDVCPIRDFDNYQIQNNGICFDGDIASVRYSIEGHCYKMKIGKYVNKYIDTVFTPDSFVGYIFQNKVLRTFFVEEITELWKNKRLKDTQLHIVIDKDFQKTYSQRFRPADSQYFNSCMDERDNWRFYRDNDDIFRTVRLEDDEGLVYARCILTTCYDEEHHEHTLLERIYFNKRCYRDMLFEMAKTSKIFDIYKDLDASCHEGERIKTIDNKQFRSYIYINLDLHDEDSYMSYQDTFKFYYPEEGKAWNHNWGNGWVEYLDTTNTYYETEHDPEEDE